MQLKTGVLLAVAEELQAVLGFPSDHLFTTREIRPMRVQMICSILKLNKSFIMVMSELYINVYKIIPYGSMDYMRNNNQNTING